MIIIRISLVILAICMSILGLDTFYAKVMHSTTLMGGFLPDEYIAPLCILCLILTVVIMIFISRKEKYENAKPIESIHTFSITKLNDEQFHNDFSKVPGGIEVGVKNIPRPQNHVYQTRMMETKDDLVMEDLAKIGIVSDNNQKPK